MSYKVYNYSLEFIDCPYDDRVKSKIAELIKQIESTGGKISANYELEVSKNDDGSVSSTKNSNGLNDDQLKMLDAIELLAMNSAKSGGKKSKIKNEVEVEREA